MVPFENACILKGAPFKISRFTTFYAKIDGFHKVLGFRHAWFYVEMDGFHKMHGFIIKYEHFEGRPLAKYNVLPRFT